MSLTIKKCVTTFTCAALLSAASVSQADTYAEMVALGKSLFNNEMLSKPIGQSCASCHAPETGFTSPDMFANATGAVVHGAIRRRAGNRKPPTSAYVTYAANFEERIGRNGLPSFSGGTFFDGRATGEAVTDEIFPSSWDDETLAQMSALLGPAVDQAMGPLLNDVEQNLDNPRQLCMRVRYFTPVGMWYKAWGEPLRCNDPAMYDTIHKRVAFAIAAFEGSAEVSPFNSKWDWAIAAEPEENQDGSQPLSSFTEEENLGLEIYNQSCGRFCHAGTVEHDGIEKQLFTRPNAGYHNIGVPKNDQNPFYRMNRVRDDNRNIINPLGGAWVDMGLAGRGEGFEGQEGKMKTPTLRNVAKKPSPEFIKVYMHNGYFKNLKNLVHFYNTRDMKQSCEEMLGLTFDPNYPMVVMDVEAVMFDCWPASEVTENVFACDDDEGDCKVELGEGETFETYCENPENPRDVGNLCLSEEEEWALVRFLETLSDQ